MKHILLLTAALASLPLMAGDALDAYRKEVKPFLEEKKLDAYGKMRHLLIKITDFYVCAKPEFTSECGNYTHQNFKKCRFTCSVRTDNCQFIIFQYFKGYISKRSVKSYFKSVYGKDNV